MRFQLLLFCAAVGLLRADVERVEVTFDYVRAKAQALAERPYKEPDTRLPSRLETLTYDEYRSIRFNPAEALWREESLPFQLQFFHRGGLFREGVELFEFSSSHAQDIPFLKRFFDYTQVGGDLGWLRSSLNYAGFRVHYPLNRPEYHDEVLVFLGASYFRAVAAGQVYGLSARGLAIDSGLDSVPEEFPRFTTFWIGKPQPSDTTLRIYALLDSKRVAGAYSFLLHPGRVSAVDVQATLYFREDVKEPGWAPLTSMFWFGENTDRPVGEPRPEVHDSDGLWIQTGDGGTLWRPLHNTTRPFATEFSTSQLQRFGLMQRDRAFANYQDPEAQYHRRPSAWIEPKGNWGSGRVRLVELPADKEYGDNIGAYWRPDAPAKPGAPVEFAYRLVFASEAPGSNLPGRVIATRAGELPNEPRGRLFWVDFNGEGFDKLAPDSVGAAVEPGAGVEIRHQGVVRLPDGQGWRVLIQAVVAEGNERAELRCTLRKGYDPVSETWTFAWRP